MKVRFIELQTLTLATNSNKLNESRSHLAKQMGTSVKMIELHYGHFQPAQKANVIAGKRMGSKKKAVAAIEAEKT